MFLFVILYPINLFILARILFPFAAGAAERNFKEFYFDNYKKFFIGVMVLSALTLLENLFGSHLKLRGQFNQLMLFLMLGFIVYKNDKVEWLHKILVVLVHIIL